MFQEYIQKTERLYMFECVLVFNLPATLVRTCMFSSSTARGSRYSAARPASTSASLLFTWLRRSRYSLHKSTSVTTDIAHFYWQLFQFKLKTKFTKISQTYWSLRSVNCFSRLDISSKHSILLRSQSSSSISGIAESIPTHTHTHTNRSGIISMSWIVFICTHSVSVTGKTALLFIWPF